MKDDIDINQILGTPVEHEVTLLYELANAMDILVNDIDNQLAKTGHSFTGEKKRHFNAYAQSVKNATFHLDKIGLERVLWKATNENFNVYDNALADSYEMIRFLMLYIDRSHDNEESFHSIYQHLSNLPQTGIFPDGYVNRFNFARPYVFGAGDRVMTDKGEGVIQAPGNGGNWVVKINDKQEIINEDNIKLL